MKSATRKMLFLILTLLLTLPTHLFSTLTPTSLKELEQMLLRDLDLINYPPLPWKPIHSPTSKGTIYDVVIIGAGMAGLTAGAALIKEGIFNIRLFDRAPEGLEGPWVTYARMRTLRSPKEEMGPALGIPNLTFQAWYQAQFGIENWHKMKKIPNDLWMDYLKWYRKILKLPVQNEWTLLSIHPQSNWIDIEFQTPTGREWIKSHKVVLATGRAGYGGPEIPEFMRMVPKTHYAHVMEWIDFNQLKEKKVGVIGAGSSALDAIAVCLETGAAQVDLISRRTSIPCINKFSSLPDQCFQLAYYHSTDLWRWTIMCGALGTTTPPPIESVKRIQGYPQFTLRTNVDIREIRLHGNQLEFQTNQGKLCYDYLILGTGYKANGFLQPELNHIMDKVLLWSDQLPADKMVICPKFGLFPYLGSSFELVEREKGTAPWLKNIYCFNYASMMSHGLLCNDITSISFGALRLAQGIATAFFLEESETFLECLLDYDEADFDLTDFFH